MFISSIFHIWLPTGLLSVFMHGKNPTNINKKYSVILFNYLFLKFTSAIIKKNSIKMSKKVSPYCQIINLKKQQTN